MILKHNNGITTYPFIHSCSMELRPGLKLAPGSVRHVNLYPGCGNINYAQITRIGPVYASGVPPVYSEMVIGDESGKTICTVIFNIADKNTTQGVAYHDAIPCGAVSVSNSMLPVLMVDYRPTLGSLIFTPSAVHPRPLSTSGGRLRTSAGQVSSVKFVNSEDDNDEGLRFEVTDNGTTISLSGEEPRSNVLRELRLADVKISVEDGQHLRIIPKAGSPVRTAIVDGEILLGVGCEL